MPEDDNQPSAEIQGLTPDDARILELWAKVYELSDREMNELFGLIKAKLEWNPVHSAYQTLVRLTNEQNGEEFRKAFINQFIADNILSRISTQTLYFLKHPNMLVGNYKKFLISQIRYHKTRSDFNVRVSQSEEGEKGLEGSSEVEVEFDPPYSGRTLEENADLQVLLERISKLGHEKISELRQSANEFLDRFDEESGNWVVIFLGGHHCCENRGTALYRLAKDHDIPSHHNRAQKLGITGPKGGYTRAQPWAKTLIGEWLAELDVPVDSLEIQPRVDHDVPSEYAVVDEMLRDAALKILCDEALQRYQGHQMRARDTL